MNLGDWAQVAGTLLAVLVPALGWAMRRLSKMTGEQKRLAAEVERLSADLAATADKVDDPARRVDRDAVCTALSIGERLAVAVDNALAWDSGLIHRLAVYGALPESNGHDPFRVAKEMRQRADRCALELRLFSPDAVKRQEAARELTQVSASREDRRLVEAALVLFPDDAELGAALTRL
ncbi:MAG: hypothetical protein OEY23_23400 [Acidimicrobiia bacterium]|nr:hypothetical protein [Acidimicrobiia bacterium]